VFFRTGAVSQAPQEQGFAPRRFFSCFFSRFSFDRRGGGTQDID